MLYQNKLRLCVKLTCLLTAIVTGSAYAHSFTQTELAYMPAVKQIELFKKGTIAPIDVLEAGPAQVRRKTRVQGFLCIDPGIPASGRVRILTHESLS